MTLKGAARSFRTKKHAYLLTVMSNEEGHEQTFARFLDSLALGPKPSGERIVDTTNTQPDAPPGAAGPGRGGDAGGAAGEGPFRHGDVTRKALIVFKPEPAFTEKARRNNTTGVVRLRCVLSSSGKVANVSIVKGLPDGLTEMAISAARHILFFPAVKDGRKVSQYVILEYNFNIY
jgi:TonB family protein